MSEDTQAQPDEVTHAQPGFTPRQFLLAAPCTCSALPCVLHASPSLKAQLYRSACSLPLEGVSPTQHVTCSDFIASPALSAAHPSDGKVLESTGGPTSQVLCNTAPLPLHTERHKAGPQSMIFESNLLRKSCPPTGWGPLTIRMWSSVPGSFNRLQTWSWLGSEGRHPWKNQGSELHQRFRGSLPLLTLPESP